ncbi:4'-phosphopantetheinyl transferase family protein [Agrococcus jejuensis]|uniref:4'-phosphopantetheinyl transferase n=1 Tax=Agrococcus jejuensis TaxID=399736 RepID=A0A1G8AH41_9MICO|nr:4'-phosphopantetheinyl transferase superfamily protein [Agrococcus jejuensis]SDH20199.1 4'-phosphopantetheinyl transferase [Agrococcus jejuensis]
MIDVLAASVDDVHALADRLGHAVPGSGLGAERLVSDRDRVAAGARLRAEDSRRTLAGRAALRMLLAARVGVPTSDAAALAIDRTCTQCGEQHGQPRVDGLSVSSSTSGTHVLVAVGDADARVGVDVEVVPEELWTGFDAYALHPDERGSMPDGADGVSQRIRAWAQKEAVLKSVGLGLRAAPARLRISAVETPGAWPSGAGMLDPGAWRPVATTEVRDAAGSWVTSLDGADDAWWMLAAATPQPIRRWTLDDLAAAHPSAA